MRFKLPNKFRPAVSLHGVSALPGGWSRRYDARMPPRSSDRPRPPGPRGFRPDYLSFAGTYQCNLTCPHCCVPIEWPDRLDIPVAICFLEDARREGVRTLGFTGGEPFVYPEFVLTITR